MGLHYRYLPQHTNTGWSSHQ